MRSALAVNSSTVLVSRLRYTTFRVYMNSWSKFGKLTQSKILKAQLASCKCPREHLRRIALTRKKSRSTHHAPVTGSI